MFNYAFSFNEFLWLSIITVSLVALFSKVYFEYTDPSNSLTLPEIPDKIDPFAIAYLRGGNNEVLRIVLISLIIKGYLKVEDLPNDKSKKKPKIRSIANPSTQYSVTYFEKKIYHYFSPDAEPINQLYHQQPLLSFIASYTTDFEARFYKNNFLASNEQKKQANLIAKTVGYIFAYLILERIQIDNEGYGWFLFIGVISWIIVYFSCSPERVNNLGHRYLARLRLIYPSPDKVSIFGNNNFSSLLVTVSLFGSTVFENSPFSYLIDVFEKAYYQAGSQLIIKDNADCGSCEGDGGCGGCGGCG